MSDPAFIDAQSLAALLGVSASTVRRWARLGLVPHYKAGDGKQTRFIAAEVLAHLRRQPIPTTNR